MKAYNDKVLVDLVEKKGSLTDTLQEGVVVSVGNLVESRVNNINHIKEGDVVLIEENAKPTPIPHEGKTLYLFRNHQILVIK